MIKLITLIQSYDRYDKLVRLINQINAQASIPIIVVNDGSDDDRYKKLTEIYPNVTVIHNEKNLGKTLYWKTVNKGLAECKVRDFDFILHFDDDMIISSEFFHLIKHINKNDFLLTFQTEQNQVKWQGTNWVDCSFISPRSFWEKINFTLDPIPLSRWENNKMTSTGVWQQVTLKLNLYGYKVEMPKYSLCYHDGNDDSKHNSSLRKHEPLETWNFYDSTVRRINNVIGN